jgi:hypothetical protein
MKSYLILALFLIQSFLTIAAPGDTVRVKTHDNVLIATDPSNGFTAYPAWGVFPELGANFHKAWFDLSFECPTGQNCGEWDYLNYIYIRRKNGVEGQLLNLELARYITPYGNSFTPTWKASYKMDISDIESLLRDSVEIEYRHTGYETNVGRGWKINLEFVFIEGIAPRPFLGINEFWNGQFNYGNASSPINEQLTPKNITYSPVTSSATLHIVQTGHGADNVQYCAEFCPKKRTLYRNNTAISDKDVWRDNCGLNPVYPQAGTWVYDRTNWCPGDLVYPDKINFTPTPGTTEEFRMEMEAFTNTDAGQAPNYVIEAYLIEFGSPAKQLDASIEEILAPNTDFRFNRMNPICGKPKIKLMNKGANNLTSVKFSYGVKDGPMSEYTWTGNLAFLESTEVELAPNVNWVSTSGKFEVNIIETNGTTDGYSLNKRMLADFIAPLLVPETFVVSFKSNNAPQENNWFIENANGNVIETRSGFDASTVYSDTLSLPSACYTFVLQDSDKDGISWWANNDGNGFIRFRKADAATNIKSWGGDFGTELRVNFTTGVVLGLNEIEEVATMEIFPNPAQEQVTVQFSEPIKEEGLLEVINITGQSILKQGLSTLSGEFVTLNVSQIPEGIYFICIKMPNFSSQKRFLIVR